MHKSTSSTTIYQLYIKVANAINIVYIHVIKYNRCMYNVNSQASACEIEMWASVWEIRLCAVFVWCANLFGSFALSSSFPSSLYLSFCFSSALVSVCACVCISVCVCVCFRPIESKRIQITNAHHFPGKWNTIAIVWKTFCEKFFKNLMAHRCFTRVFVFEIDSSRTGKPKMTEMWKFITLRFVWLFLKLGIFCSSTFSFSVESCRMNTEYRSHVRNLSKSWLRLNCVLTNRSSHPTNLIFTDFQDDFVC